VKVEEHGTTETKASCGGGSARCYAGAEILLLRWDGMDLDSRSFEVCGGDDGSLLPVLFVGIFPDVSGFEGVVIGGWSRSVELKTATVSLDLDFLLMSVSENRGAYESSCSLTFLSDVVVGKGVNE